MFVYELLTKGYISFKHKQCVFDVIKGCINYFCKHLREEAKHIF
jgi:hypothetical protein